MTVVNEAFARKFWPGDSPAAAALGRRVSIGSRDLTIIGVVHDAKYHALSDPAQPFMYLAYEQWNPSALTIGLRTDGDPLRLVAPLRAVFHDVAPGLPFLDPRTLADQVDGALTLQRLGATLLSTLGALALVIAALGLYGALSQAVVQRQREIGIRMALGARASDVVGQFTRRGLGLALIGVLVGVPGVFLAGRLLQKQVYGVGALDPLSLLVTATIFAGVALIASLVTAIRGSRVDPASSIRVE